MYCLPHKKHPFLLQHTERPNYLPPKKGHNDLQSDKSAETRIVVQKFQRSNQLRRGCAALMLAEEIPLVFGSIMRLSVATGDATLAAIIIK